MEKSPLNDIPNQTNSHVFSRVFIGIAVGLLLGIGMLLYGNNLADKFTARAYTPSAESAAVRDSLHLTNEGTVLYNASAPQIEAANLFNASCQSTERTQAILGCYTSRRIYIYDVTNPELTGAKEVTAAHELLHAAYDRLNVLDRPNVDRLVNAEYEKHKNDEDIQKLVAYYQKAEPGAQTNELHSIIGTIKSDISPELERYYARYFTDRQAIVRTNSSYNAVFDSLEQQSKQLNDQIAAQKPAIEQSLADYTRDLNQLDSDIATFNTQAKTGYFKNQSSFYAARQVLAARVDALNERRAVINEQVNTYNDLVARENKLSVQVNELNSSINAAPAAGGV